MTINLEKLLDDFPGMPVQGSANAKRQYLHTQLVEAGHDLAFSSVRKWFERGSIPSDWIVRILKLAEDKGRKIDLLDYA